MRFDILTIFPGMIEGYAKESILGRAQKSGLIDVKAHDIRAFADNKHNKVDDTPYGGGAGMVMAVQPIDKALKAVKKRFGSRVILMSASGKRFTQEDAKRFASYKQVIFICGRYEGIDSRVEEHLVDESLSIGDFVLTGGELPALTMIDATARMVPGVLGNAESLLEESHTDGLLEYPQYTKPEAYSFRKGLKRLIAKVPDVLLSGNHKAISDWRKKNAKNP
jgi:tRNA (guanine37-N1)-methyltransferase